MNKVCECISTTVTGYREKLTVWLNHIPHISLLAIRCEEWHKVIVLPIIALFQLGAKANGLLTYYPTFQTF